MILAASTIMGAMRIFGYAICGMWGLAFVAILIAFFDMLPKTRRKISKWWGVYYTKFSIWKRLRPYRKHLQGIDLKEMFPDGIEGVEKDTLSGEQRALIMMHLMVKNEKPVSLFQVIEAQLNTTAECRKDTKDAMMFTMEFVKAMRTTRR